MITIKSKHEIELMREAEKSMLMYQVLKNSRKNFLKKWKQTKILKTL